MRVAALAALGAAVFAAPVEGEYIAYWAWTWGAGSRGPPGAAVAISFSGWANVTTALAQSKVQAGRDTLIDVGGGNANGRWSAEQLATLDAGFFQQVAGRGFKGIAYDIEECTGTIDPAAFAAVFAAAKRAGLTNVVTMSHSAPYGCVNKVPLVRAWLADPNVDVISPQLYTSGNEAHPDYTAVGIQWDAFKDRPPTQKLAPSIPNASQYDEMKAYFEGRGVAVDGFIQWQQV